MTTTEIKLTALKQLRLLSYKNNAKLKGGNIPSLGLPASETCLSMCPSCYALKGRYKLKVVQRKLKRNLELAKSKGFEEVLSSEIDFLKTKYGVRYIRIHDSGDFFSKEYVDSIKRVFQRHKDVIGYAYTKRLNDPKLRDSLLELKSLPNFIIIDSLKFGGLNYFKKKEAIEFSKANSVPICPAYTHKATCNAPCKICLNKKVEDTGVVFVKH